MRNTRLAPWLGCPALLLALGTGCQALHGYRPVTVLARDADTEQPLPGAWAQISYPLASTFLAPQESSARSEADGIARLQAAPYGDKPLLLEVCAEGYLPERRLVPVADVKSTPPAHLFEAPGRRPVSCLVPLHAEKPVPTVELVLPPSYRGLVRVEIRVAEDAPDQAGPRWYSHPVPPSGVVCVTGPALLRRFTFPNFTARYADGAPLNQEAKGPEVGFWDVRFEENNFTFLVGTRAEYEEYRKGHPQESPGERTSPGGGKRGRGRGRRGGGQPASDS
jgi:hypothetical protein